MTSAVLIVDISDVSTYVEIRSSLNIDVLIDFVEVDLVRASL